MEYFATTLARSLAATAAIVFLLPGVSLAADPARGDLLIAARDLLDPNFAKSVIFLLHYDEHGAFGVIVNRRTQMRPTEILPGIDALEDYRGQVYLGGPVALGNLVVLIRTEESSGDAEPIIDGVVALSSFENLNEIVARNPAEVSLRLYAGYAGWGAGQLDHELARDDWHLVPATSEDVFSDTPDELWQRLLPPPRPLQVKTEAELQLLADSFRGGGPFTGFRLRPTADP